MHKLSITQRGKARQFMDFTGDSEENAIWTLTTSLWQLESAYDVFYSQPRSKAEMRGYLEFVNNNITMLTNFRWLLENLKLGRLKALAETSPVATTQIADTMFPLVFELLMDNMPKQKSEENMNYEYIECLQYVLHHLDHNKTADDTPQFRKEDFKKRLKWVQHLTMAKMEKLAQTFSTQDKYYPKDWESDPLKSLLKSDWERERKKTKAEVRCCINILAMTKVLQRKAPSFIQEDTVNLSWKESRNPPASKTPRQYGVLELSQNRDQYANLSRERQYHLQEDGYSYLKDGDVEDLLGLSRYQRLNSNREGSFLLNDQCGIGMLTWQLKESEFSSCFVKGRESNKGISGKVRNQFYHLLCWAYAGSDLVSAVRCMRNWEDTCYPLCTWYLSSFTHPEKLGKTKSKPDKDGFIHHCYGSSIERGLHHIQENGIPKEFVDTFLCTDHIPPTADEPEKKSRRIITIQKINSMKDAIIWLQKNPKQPLGADLIAYYSLFEVGKEKIYYGPRSESDTFWGYHAIVIEDFQMINGQLVAVCKMSNGKLVADAGYAYVSVATQYIPVGVCETKMSSIRGSDEPMHLLTNFITVDMDVKEEADKEYEEEEDTEEDDAKEDQEEEEEDDAKEDQEEEEYIHEAKRRRSAPPGLNRVHSHFTHRQLLRVLGHGDAEKLANSKVVPASGIEEGRMGLDIGPDSIKTFNEAPDTTQTVIWNGPTGVFEMEKFAAGTEVVPASGIEEGRMGLDIGPDSIKTFNEAPDTTQTVIWNGPTGVFEMEKFAAGTEAVANKLAELSEKRSDIGGGDSVAAVEKVGVAGVMSHISTGGGAV